MCAAIADRLLDDSHVFTSTSNAEINAAIVTKYICHLDAVLKMKQNTCITKDLTRFGFSV